MNSTIVNPKELIDHFIALASIDSPSLNERSIADHLKKFLSPFNVKVIEDASATVVNGNTGNLICLPPHYDSQRPSIALCAHLDTVQPTKDLKPVVNDEKISSDGTTILGADNREGLAILTALMKHLSKIPSPVANFICVFTVGEELGMYGANAVDLAPYNVREAYVFDCSKRPGIYIKDCAGCLVFTARVRGISAHAGVAPEQGLSAIMLAANALTSVKFGRIDEETTSNIGTISGGSATNVVPDEVILNGEVRSFTPEKIETEFSKITKAFQSPIDGVGKFSITSQMDFHPYVLTDDSPVVQKIEKAIASVGLTPHGIRYTGGSDANSYNAKNIPAVNIGIGAQKPHSHEEFILIEDLLTSMEIAVALVRQ